MVGSILAEQYSFEILLINLPVNIFLGLWLKIVQIFPGLTTGKLNKIIPISENSAVPQ